MDREHVIATLRQHEAELKTAGIVRLSLFGSVARNEATPQSDVYLIAEFDNGREQSLLDRARLENRLADMLGAKVELAPARMLKDGIREHAVREAVLAFQFEALLRLGFRVGQAGGSVQMLAWSRV